MATGLARAVPLYRRHERRVDPVDAHDIDADRASDPELTWSSEHGGHWVAATYDSVCAVAKNADAFSSAHSVHVPPTGLYERGIRIFVFKHDGDEHRAQRAILARAVGGKPGHVRRDVIERCLTELLGNIDWSRPVDLIERLADPLPLDVVFALMGADPEFKPEMKRLTDALTRRAKHEGDVDPAARVHEIARVMVERRLATPRDDWITRLQGESINDAALSTDDMVEAVVSLITGGHHSTSRALGSLLARVLTEPLLVDHLRENPALSASVIDETLRLHTPLPEFSRTATCPVRVGQVSIEPRSAVQLRYDLANRDPDAFEDPEAFRLDRRRSQHLAFGFGPHRCVGVHLARAELQIALTAVLAVQPDLRPVQEEVRWAYSAQPISLVVQASLAPATSTEPGGHVQ